MSEGASHQRADVVEEAWDSAGAAAASSRVVIDAVDEVEHLHEVIALFDGIWGTAGSPPIGLEHLRALAHGGNYVVVARDIESGDAVGASVAFFAAPVGSVLHSDITGVSVAARDRKLGFALKLDQRAWALERGLETITWTFDPLVARNAYFNLAKLSARATAYYVDFYGDMTDGINRGQGSDRLLATWRLGDPAVVAACAGVPAAADASPQTVAIAVPDDVEALRRSDPDAAREWRHRLRDTLGRELAAGSRVIAFDRTRGYLIERPPS